MFTAAIITAAKTWKPTGPSTNDWIENVVRAHGAIQEKEIPTASAAMWMGLGARMLSDINPTQEDGAHVSPRVRGPWRRLIHRHRE